MKVFILPTLACDMECRGCYLAPSQRVERLLEWSAFERILNGLPRRSRLIIAGGEPSILPEGYLAKMVSLVDRRRDKEFALGMAINIMHVPGWLLDLVRSRFGGEVETSFAWARRHRRGESDEEWREAFIHNLVSLVTRENVSANVFFEVDDMAARAGPKSAMQVIKRVEDCAPGKVRWDFGVSLDTGAILAGEPFRAGKGAPMRISHREWERYVGGLAYWSGIMGLRDRIVNFDSFGCLEGDVRGGDGDEEITVSVHPDGGIYAMPLLNGAYRLPLVPAREIGEDILRLVMETEYARQWQAHAVARRRACADCLYNKVCDGGFFVMAPRGQDGCLGARTVRDLAIRQNWTPMEQA